MPCGAGFFGQIICTANMLGRIFHDKKTDSEMWEFSFSFFPQSFVVGDVGEALTSKDKFLTDFLSWIVSGTQIAQGYSLIRGTKMVTRQLCTLEINPQAHAIRHTPIVR